MCVVDLCIMCMQHVAITLNRPPGCKDQLYGAELEGHGGGTANDEIQRPPEL